MSKMVFGAVEIDTDHYEEWQRSLIYVKKQFAETESEQARQRRQETSKLQDELMAKLEEGPTAIERFIVTGVLKVADLDAARGSVPELGNLTAGEMSKLPSYAERRVAESLNGAITPSAAAEPAVWALCHAVWMGRGVFGRDLPTVFVYGSKADTAEARTRNFLRRTGGLRPVRGNISPLRDCPISAAWWRVRLAEQARTSSEGRLEFDAAHQLLRLSNVWENLVGMLLRQVTAVCAPQALAAVICALAEVHGVGTEVEREPVQAAIRALGRLSYSHCLHAVPLSALVETASQAVRDVSVDDKSEGRKPTSSQLRVAPN
ncbi:MAG: hypothetical protein OXE79_05310 [Acidimicrobiaceae bacterium]|nr:hypothetical protein [Acidimicrobiaceae bacterium]MCY4281053.1 hypothetical protein [Acidimicrobiaceae bacterium]MCY4294319.1 hypothetical protein [Acidimicrobiaceae bacterium]